MPGGSHAHSRSSAAMARRLASWAMVPACGVAGLLVGAALAMPGWRWFAVGALAPFGCALTPALKPLNAYAALGVGAAAYHAVGLHWMKAVFFGGLEGAWVFLTLVGTGCWLAGFGLLRAVPQQGHWPMAVRLPVVWLACEYLRHLLFASFDGNGMPLLWLGQALSGCLPLAQCADVAGVFALTWLLASANGALFDVAAFACRPSRWDTACAGKSVAIAGATLALAYGYGLLRMGETSGVEGPSIALLTGEVQSDWKDIVARGTTPFVPGNQDSEQWAATVDLLVWPELAYGGIILTRDGEGLADTPDAQDLLGRAAKLGKAMVIGARREEKGRRSGEQFNSAVFVDHESKRVLTQDKTHLVAFAESRGLALTFLSSLLGEPIEWNGGRFARGERCEVFPVRPRGADCVCPVGVTICYDIYFPAIHRRLINPVPPGGPAAEAFICMLNESLDATGSLTYSSLAHARLRAIEFRRPYYRVSEGGICAIVDSGGRIAEYLVSPPGEPNIVVGSVPLDGRRTLYGLLGDWLPITSCLILLIAAIVGCWVNSTATRDR